VGRRPDVERRVELLDAVVAYLGQNGLAAVSLRPMATAIGVSVNALVHHFGTKEQMVVAALRRANEIQLAILERWLARDPELGMADLLRRWWRWMNSSPARLAHIRLGIEAAALEATASGLPGDVRAEQIGLWRLDIERRLTNEGVPPDRVELEASLLKAMFTGIVVDLLATGERRRLGAALELGLTRLTSLLDRAP
jgi:AcrR family transcriptional regulator